MTIRTVHKAAILAALVLVALASLSRAQVPDSNATAAAPAASPAPAEPAPVPDVTVTPAARQAVDSALQYLAVKQNLDGSWTSQEFKNATAVASLAGLAFMSDGSLPARGRYADNVSRALDYVVKSAQPNGLLEYDSPKHAMYSHAFSTLFLAEAWGMTGALDLKVPLKNAVDLIVRTQNREGGWRYLPVVADADISVTVSEIVALRAAANAGIAVPREAVDNAVGFLKKCACPNGGFAYQAGGNDAAFPRSAAALLCLYLTGVSDAPLVPRALNYVTHNREFDGRYSFYGQYYAAQAVHLVAPAKWPEWYAFVTNRLVARQGRDGSWNAVGEDRAQCTAMSALILTIPNGYLPLYQR
jgi:prenyltransferase beta subunit